jgi:RimJ/RimL family protein N-acetyltransferase
MSWLELGTDPEGAATNRVQSFMLANGVVPFSGSMLLGRCGPARTLAIVDVDGNVVASACTYLPHNDTSVHAHTAWGGLVAVDPSQRGLRLGVLINAAMVKSAFDELAAESIYELVSPSNMASRRMVEACGLRHDPAVVSGVAAPVDGTRYTR